MNPQDLPYGLRPLEHTPPPLKRQEACSECAFCESKFSLFKLKHNCYNCGNVLCNACLGGNKLLLPKFGYIEATPVCTFCFRFVSMSRMNSSQLSDFSVKQLKEYLSMYGLHGSFVEKSDIAEFIVTTPLRDSEEIHFRSLVLMNAKRARSPSVLESFVSDLFGHGGGSPSRQNSTAHRPVNRPEPSNGPIPPRRSTESSRSAPGGYPRSPSPHPPPPAATAPGDDFSLPDLLTEIFMGMPQALQEDLSGSRPVPPPPRSGGPHRQQSFPSSYPSHSQAPSRSDVGGPPSSRDIPDSSIIEEIPTLASLLKNRTDISKLPTRVLKEILKRNDVAFAGVLEKSELESRVQTLLKNTKLEALQANEELVCKICCDAPINCVLLECGHVVTCLECAHKIQETTKECPVCRTHISRVVHTFRA